MKSILVSRLLHVKFDYEIRRKYPGKNHLSFSTNLQLIFFALILSNIKSISIKIGMRVLEKKHSTKLCKN